VAQVNEQREDARVFGRDFFGKGFRSSTQDEESVLQMMTLLDVQDASPSIRRLRDWALFPSSRTALT